MLSKGHQALFLESLVWLDLGLKPSLPYKWETLRPLCQLAGVCVCVYIYSRQKISKNALCQAINSYMPCLPKFLTLVADSGCSMFLVTFPKFTSYFVFKYHIILLCKDITLNWFFSHQMYRFLKINVFFKVSSVYHNLYKFTDSLGEVLYNMIWINSNWNLIDKDSSILHEIIFIESAIYLDHLLTPNIKSSKKA